jgi:hypothetical protein
LFVCFFYKYTYYLLITKQLLKNNKKSFNPGDPGFDPGDPGDPGDPSDPGLILV